MKKLLTILILLIVATGFSSRACVCAEEDYLKRDSIFDLDNIYNDYPVIFVGEYLGWDYYALRVYRVLRSYKGIEESVEYFTLKDGGCNMLEKVGDKVFVCAYPSPFNSKGFLTCSNCRGTQLLKPDFNINHTGGLAKKVEINGLNPVEISNRKLEGLSQMVFNSINYNFKLRDDDGKIISNYKYTSIDERKIEEQKPHRTHYVIWVFLGISLLLNLWLIIIKIIKN